mmetsp:Transcript_1222/g.2222  ORF Transcript_1222/g.2222 Transcript_1222/m.2222 type:complete len:230 (+) Transcript_1222:269-958(+)
MKSLVQLVDHAMDNPGLVTGIRQSRLENLRNLLDSNVMKESNHQNQQQQSRKRRHLSSGSSKSNKTTVSQLKRRKKTREKVIKATNPNLLPTPSMIMDHLQHLQLFRVLYPLLHDVLPEYQVNTHQMYQAVSLVPIHLRCHQCNQLCRHQTFQVLTQLYCHLQNLQHFQNDIPTNIPTRFPSKVPSHKPSESPTLQPSLLPSDETTGYPTSTPSITPTKNSIRSSKHFL